MLGSLFQEKYGVKRGALWRGNAGVAVPRGAVHPESTLVLAQNDAIIAQHAHAGFGHPQARRGALAGARVAKKQITAAVGVRQAKRMDFHALAQSEAVHHGEFINWIFQRKHGNIRGKRGAIEQKMAARKRSVKPGGFIRSAAKSR